MPGEFAAFEQKNLRAFPGSRDSGGGACGAAPDNNQIVHAGKSVFPPR
jgi:hypothetical protein